MTVKAMYLGYVVKKAFERGDMKLPERIGIKFLDLETYDVKAFTVASVPEWGNFIVTEQALIIGTLHVAVSQYGEKTRVAFADFTDRQPFALKAVKTQA